ncbi:MAG TPA: hypothetical protein VN643_14225 [Pyrinomonadaceae bacterium]|nr:hypothetical protein [Pyrinomonadaceae bacterium]
MYRRYFQFILSAILLSSLNAVSVFGQEPAPQTPITSQELVRLLYQLPRHPEQRDELVEEIRKRGLGFALTDGMRSLVANKSGSDPILKRTLEEAERRRANPKTETLPTEAEANELLRLTTNVTLAASGAMPDFIVRQLIKRSVAYGNTANWIPQDTLTIGVSYRSTSGEEYKVLTVNGMPPGPDAKAGSEYGDSVGGASSTGEYVTGLANLFKEEAHTSFRMVDTDVLRGQRTIVYEYEVDLPYSSLVLKADKSSTARVASRGRVWLDREQYRVLRFEQIATQIPGAFPIRAASSTVDYDWVKINERPYLLPSHAEILITSLYKDRQLIQSRNDIRFRGYQKFGAELKIYDEVDDELPLDNAEQEKPKKPDKPDKP